MHQMPNYHPDAQWFQPLGKCCCGCGKPATGTLRGYRNDDRGPYTDKCADRAIKAAHKHGGMMPDFVRQELQAGDE
jgi:hypothetical protein